LPQSWPTVIDRWGQATAGLAGAERALSPHLLSEARIGSHCFDRAKAIAASAKGGVVEQCGHWVFEEKTDFIVQELRGFWDDMQRTQVEDKPVLA
jgi:pimeloyl-ACP methyl ester carboxylesterase